MSDSTLESQNEFFLSHFFRDESLWLAVGSAVLLVVAAVKESAADVWLQTHWGYGFVGIFWVVVALLVGWCVYLAKQQRMVVFIDDDLTPEDQDIKLLLLVLVGLPIIWLVLLGAVYLIIPPLQNNNFDKVYAISLIIIWSLYIYTQIVRSYYYNRNGGYAFLAVLLKIALGAIFIISVFTAVAALMDKKKSIGSRIGDALGGAMIALLAYDLMEKLTYRGPSLRQPREAD